MMAFSDRLHMLMKQRDIKQTTLADQLRVSQQTISRWVTGRFQPDIDQLIALAQFFDVSVDYLLDHDTKKAPTVDDDGLRACAINRVSGLSDPALARVLDFLSGLEAGQGIGAAPAAAPDPDAGSSR